MVARVAPVRLGVAMVVKWKHLRLNVLLGWRSVHFYGVWNHFGNCWSSLLYCRVLVCWLRLARRANWWMHVLEQFFHGRIVVIRDKSVWPLPHLLLSVLHITEFPMSKLLTQPICSPFNHRLIYIAILLRQYIQLPLLPDRLLAFFIHNIARSIATLFARLLLTLKLARDNIAHGVVRWQKRNVMLICLNILLLYLLLKDLSFFQNLSPFEFVMGCFP